MRVWRTVSCDYSSQAGDKLTKRTLIIACSLAAALLGIVVVKMVTSPDTPITGISSIFTPIPSLVDNATLNSFSKQSSSSANTSHVAAGIIPPANSWISGAVLHATPHAIFPMPLSFLPKETGFEIGLPSIQASSQVISGGHTAGMGVTLSSATSFSLTRFDKISATLTYKNNQKTLGTLTFAEGSPFVWYRAESASELKLDGTGPSAGDASSTYMQYEKDGHGYAIAASAGATLSRDGSTIHVTAPAKSLVTLYALPGSSADPLRAFASNELKEVTVSSRTEGSNSLTTLEYATKNGKPTVFVPMSYSTLNTTSEPLLRYASIYGAMPAYPGTEFTLRAPLKRPSEALGLSRLSRDDKQTLIASLREDVARTVIEPQDSYFAGKALARAATLLMLAKELGQEEMSTQLITILKNAFTARLSNDYFYYDTTLRGIAAKTKAFGSEDFNDHHFHYGYFLYAASILGKHDQAFLSEYKHRINLLVADIASYTASEDFPVQRNYDPYAQHSWAAGLAPFADGNNQESSSEAINAWDGAALWAKVTDNKPLESSAIWMLSNEMATAEHAWRAPSTTLDEPYLKPYTSPVSSLNFGGKRTYSTFFSDEASAKLGIQLLPMTPVMLQISEGSSAVRSITASSIRQDNFNVALGDYILMYAALEDPSKAKKLLLHQTTVDDGNSKTYLQAWVLSRASK